MPVGTDSTCVLQNVGSVRQLLYDFPWTNVGKLVFVVSQRRHHTLFQHIAPRNIFPLSFFFFLKGLFYWWRNPNTPLACNDEPADRGPGNFYARLFFFFSLRAAILSEPCDSSGTNRGFRRTAVPPLLTCFACNKHQNDRSLTRLCLLVYHLAPFSLKPAGFDVSQC